MHGHLAPHPRVLENQHRLQQLRRSQPELPGQPPQLLLVGKGLEVRVKVVHGVAELVHRTLAVDPGRVLFHEGAHDIAGTQEVVLARVLVINGVESVPFGFLNQLV